MMLLRRILKALDQWLWEHREPDDAPGYAIRAEYERRVR